MENAKLRIKKNSADSPIALVLDYKQREYLIEEFTEPEDAYSIGKNGMVFEIWIGQHPVSTKEPTIISVIEELKEYSLILEGLNELGLIERWGWATDGGYSFMEIDLKSFKI